MIDQNRIDIIDKLNGFEITQKKVYIKTKPSSRFPNGKHNRGVIRFVYPEKNKISLDEIKEGIIDVYISDIASPSDIEESKT